MTDFDEQHEPSAEFLASLGREISREYRRDEHFESFDQADGRRRSHRVATIAGLTMGGVITLTVGLVLGASTGYASAEVIRARANHDSIASPPQPALTILKTLPVRDAINAVTCAAASLAAEQSRKTQAAEPTQGIPVVALPEASVKSTDRFGAVLGIRQAPDGSVLVDDAGHRQIKLLDASLAGATIVMDSVPGSARSYGVRPTPLVPYLGDSVLVPDLASRTVLLLDSHGQIGRTLALPTTSDLGLLMAGGATDDQGRLVYLGKGIIPPRATGPDLRGVPTADLQSTTLDSTPLLRADFVLRRTDTVGHLARRLGQTTATSPDGNSVLHVWTVDPLATIDDWAVLSSGTIAVVRGHDYHVDWFPSSAPAWSSPKLPFDWKRLSEEDKTRILDSTRTALTAKLRDLSLFDNAEQLQLERHGGGGNGGPPPADGGGRGQGRGAGGGGGGNPFGRFGDFTVRSLDVVSPDQLPDYYPPLRVGSAMADRDGNLWILPTTSKYSKQGELVYDVVNAKGDLYERVRVPLGRLIVGFGRAGVVYMVSGNRADGFTLERSTLSR